MAEIGAFGGALLIKSTLGQRDPGMTLITLHRTFPDMEMIMRYFIQINLYLSPVLYLSSEMHPIQHQVMLFNPFAHIVNIVRDIVMGTDEIDEDIRWLDEHRHVVCRCLGRYRFSSST